MKALRTVMLVLAIAHAALAVFAALAGAFADGGDVWSRLLLILIHPLCAAALLLLALLPRPGPATVLAVAALLIVNVGADLYTALTIWQGGLRGDWWLPAIFAVIPAIGVIYALTLTRIRPQPDDRAPPPTP